jgi:agmatine deiminase
MLTDAAIPAHLAGHLNLPRFRPGIALEGGSIEVNGLGTCLTT